MPKTTSHQNPENITKKNNEIRGTENLNVRDQISKARSTLMFRHKNSTPYKIHAVSVCSDSDERKIISIKSETVYNVLRIQCLVSNSDV